MDPAFRLQWICQTLLEDKSHFSTSWQGSEEDVEIQLEVSLQGLKAAPVQEDEEDLYGVDAYWSDEGIPGLRVELSCEGQLLRWYESRISPASWLTGDDSGETQGIFYGEWDEEAEIISDLIMEQCFANVLAENVVFGELPVYDIEDETAVVELWNHLWAERTFSGIGADTDTANIASLLTQLAQATGYNWMKLLSQGLEPAIYGGNWKPKGSYVNGDFEVLHNMSDLEMQTPDGLLKYEPDDVQFKTKGELTLNDEPLKFSDSQIKAWLDALETGQWAFSGKDED